MTETINKKYFVNLMGWSAALGVQLIITSFSEQSAY